jgi:Family of unknown function (DUF6263)
MKVWRWAGALCCVAAAVLGVTAYGEQGGTDKPPVFKGFESDKPFYQELTTTTTQTMKVQGQEVIQKQSQTFLVKWTVKTKAADKWTVDYEIAGVKMNIQIGGNSIDYSSTADQPPNNPLTDFFKALVGSKFTLTVVNDKDKGLQVTDVDTKDLENFVNKLAAANEQLKPLLKQILTKDAIIQMSNPTFAAFPSEKQFADGKGKWKLPVDLKMGPIGSYDTTYTYELKDKSKVEVSATMKYNPPKTGDSGGLPFTIKSGNLEAKEPAKGEINIKDGKIDNSKMTMKLSGKLDIDIAGMSTEVELNQTQESKLQSFDTEPTAWVKKK